MSEVKTAKSNIDRVIDYSKIKNTPFKPIEFKYDFNYQHEHFKKLTEIAEEFAQGSIKTVDNIKISIEETENQIKNLENCIAKSGPYIKKDLLIYINSLKKINEGFNQSLVRSQKLANEHIQWADEEKDRLEKFFKNCPVDLNIL